MNIHKKSLVYLFGVIAFFMNFSALADTEIAFWPFEEGGGSVINDATGNGNTGIVNGSVNWVTGVSGGALDFSGSTGRAVVPDSPGLDVSNQVSMALWVKPTLTATQYMLKKGRFDETDGYELSLSSSGTVFVRFNQASSGNTYRLSSSVNYPTDGNTWMHVVATYDGSTLALYINGQLNASTTVSFTIATNDLPLSIGAQDDGARPYEGAIDEVHIYDYAITAAEVDALYNIRGVDGDRDGDGVPDASDAFPDDPTEWVDTDGDGIGNNADTDDDGDGMPDTFEQFWGFDPLNPLDGDGDADLDGISNVDEYLQDSEPKTITTFATVETEPVASTGDAADDIAIWVDSNDANNSRIIGTDKQLGVAAYDLAGNQIQFLNEGQVNNVDLRYNFSLDGEIIDVAVGSNRTSNTIGVYRIDPVTGELSNVTEGGGIPSAVTEVYGICMYQSPVSGKYYAIVNSVEGEVEQYELVDNGLGLVDGVLVRSFALSSKTEGCVADDELGNLFIAEENVGIWKFGAEPDAGTTGELIDTTSSSGYLKSPEVEGLTIYYGSNEDGYLIASSQGNDEYIIYNRQAGHDYVGTIRIRAGVIDGVTFTDGIDVTNVSLGSAFPGGVFIAQDDNNSDTTQNFKLVPWDDIATAFETPLLIDTARDPRSPVSVPGAEVGFWALDEGSGSIAFDGSGNNNDAIFNGDPAWVPGVSGTALEFSGGSDRLLVADSVSIDITSRFTIAAWIKPSVRATQYVVKKARSGSTDGYELSLSNSLGVAYVRVNQATSGDAYRLNASTLYPTDGSTWMHVAATYDGTDMVIYIDGAEDSRLSAPGLVINENDHPLSLGAQDDGVAPFEGTLDEVHLFNYALAPEDIAALSSAGTSTDGDGIPDNLDNCTLVPNPAQRDTDGDGYGNYCDPDFDNNGIVQAEDLAYLKSKFFTADPDADLDGNGVVDAGDLAIFKNMLFGPPGPSCCAP